MVSRGDVKWRPDFRVQASGSEIYREGLVSASSSGRSFCIWFALFWAVLFCFSVSLPWSGGFKYSLKPLFCDLRMEFLPPEIPCSFLIYFHSVSMSFLFDLIPFTVPLQLLQPWTNPYSYVLPRQVSSEQPKAVTVSNHSNLPTSILQHICHVQNTFFTLVWFFYYFL